MEYITLQNGLLLTLAMLGGFGWRWVDRIQSQQDDLRKSLGGLREKLLEDYAKKSDVHGGDAQILERIKELDANVQRIYDKLDGKKDKDRV